MSVSIENVNVGDDLTLMIDGTRVLVYIRDWPWIEDLPKYHIAYCEKLRTHPNILDRYVVSTRTDGIFQINVDDDAGVAKSKNVALKVCLYCLRELNWDDYLHKDERGKAAIHRRFQLEDFFKAEVNGYPLDWYWLSRELRSNAGWRCQECGRDCRERKYTLHVHHIDRDKTNNDPSNLMVLCHWCHRKQPGHERMPAEPS